MTEQELQEQLTASLDAALSGLREDAFLAFPFGEGAARRRRMRCSL